MVRSSKRDLFQIRKSAADKTIAGPFGISLFIHFLIMGAGAIVMPLVIKDPPKPFTPITVEFVEIDKITQTNKVAAPKKTEDPKDEKPPEEVKSNVSPKNTQDTPPDLLTPQPPDLEESVPTPENIKEPDPQSLRAPDKPKSKPKPKPPQTKKAEPKPESDQFSSLLKNITPDAQETPKNSEERTEEQNSSEEQSLIAQLSSRLTISEEDALRHQLARCWNVQAGARDAQELVVRVKVDVNADRTVRRAVIVDQLRYQSDSHFRAAADSAVRALKNPSCSPLELPPDGYDQWKTLVINFDPREML